MRANSLAWFDTTYNEQPVMPCTAFIEIANAVTPDENGAATDRICGKPTDLYRDFKKHILYHIIAESIRH